MGKFITSDKIDERTKDDEELIEDNPTHTFLLTICIMSVFILLKMIGNLIWDSEIYKTETFEK